MEPTYEGLKREGETLKPGGESPRLEPTYEGLKRSVVVMAGAVVVSLEPTYEGLKLRCTFSDGGGKIPFGAYL